MLELNGVSHMAGGQPVLVNVGLHIAPGRPLVFLAPAGLARQSLVRLLTGRERPARGRILYGAEPASGSKALKRDLLLVSRLGAEGGRSRLAAIIRQAARTRGLSGAALEAEVGRSASAVGIADQLDAPAKRLDLEGCIRLLLAVAIAQQPKLLVLDDALRDLDSTSRQRVLADLPGIFSACAGATILCFTASPQEARGVGGDLVVLDAGRIAQTGPAASVLDHPRDLATARATAAPALNTLSVDWVEGERRLADGSSFAPPPGLTLPEGVSVTLAFRPDDLRPHRSDDQAIRFLVRGAGSEIVEDARYARVVFAGVEWRMTADEIGDPASGLMLNAFVAPHRVMVFNADGAAIRT